MQSEIRGGLDRCRPHSAWHSACAQRCASSLDLSYEIARSCDA